MFFSFDSTNVEFIHKVFINNNNQILQCNMVILDTLNNIINVILELCFDRRIACVSHYILVSIRE